jgi:ATP-dependent Clp protease ATP-binding subunit ClpA
MATGTRPGYSVAPGVVALQASLASCVKGQDHILEDVSEFLAGRIARPLAARPLASLCFIGGDSDGKTTLANAIAEFLYSPNKVVRYDGSDYQNPDARDRLVGAAAGLTKSGHGGSLTEPLIQDPRRLILFEHFERINQSAWPVLFQMLTEGQLIETGTGRVADFRQAVVIMMSKANRTGFYETFREFPDPEIAAAEVIARWSRNPENRAEPLRSSILSHVEKTYVFRPLSDAAKIEIMRMKAAEIVQEFGLELAGIDTRFLLQMHTRVRGSIREFERAFGDDLADGLIAANEAGWRRVEIDLAEDKATVNKASSIGND